MKTEKTNTKIVDLNSTISIIILHVNSLNILIKRQGLAEWIEKLTQLYAIYKKLVSNIMILSNIMI